MFAKKSIYFMFTAILFSFAFAEVASGHSHVMQSEPGEGSTVEETVETITLTFDAGVEDATTITVTDEEGNEYGLADETIEDLDYIASLEEPLSSGEYTIDWTALGDDGHTTEGVVSFTVDAEEAAETEEEAVEEDAAAEDEEGEEENIAADAEPIDEEAAPVAADDSGGGAMNWVIPVLIAVLLIGAVFFFIRRSKSSASG